MPLSLFGRNALVCGFLAVAAPAVVMGQASYLTITNGEYAIAGSLVGDQVQPQLALSVSGGYLVWQDSITDGDGLGISALRLDGSFSRTLSPFRVNSIGASEQENPQAALLNAGGAVFVWQGGKPGFQHIYARFLSASNLWLGGDLQVNTATNNTQVNPVVATLANSNVVVAWASFNQAAPTSLRDVYAQVLSPAGQKVGSEFQVNQFISFNQRDPAIAPLSDGRFVVSWVSEQQRTLAPAADTQNAFGTASVDIYARIFTADGKPAGDEFLVNASANLCSSPHIAAASDGKFMMVWAERSRLSDTNGWDIWGSTFSSAGTGSSPRCINSTRYGDQYVPSISWDGMDYLVVWTSLGQDGSREGVFGQFLHDDGSPDNNGSPAKGEFQCNTRNWIGQQIQPTVASDGHGRFLAAWTSFGGSPYGFDLYARPYINVSQPLPTMSAPYVHVPFVVINGVYQPEIQISWPFQAGLSVDHYDVYVNGALSTTLASNIWMMTAADVNSQYSFQVDYVTTSGRRSPLSPATVGTTWDKQNWKGLPIAWMAQYWGYGTTWPDPNDPVAAGGPTVLQVFLTGADPTNPATWLRTAISHTAQGVFLSWNPQPGLIYQVQTSTNLTDWQNLDSPRFAVGAVDSLFIGLSDPGLYYRVMWLR